MRVIVMLAGLFRLAGYATDPLLDSQEIHAIVGEPARLTGERGTSGPLHVVSWNIAQGSRYEQVRDALAALDADVYVLQEVDMGVRRSKYRQIARDLATDLGGLNWVFAGEFQEIGQARRGIPALTGQAILSRYPIEAAYVLPFENQARLRWRLDPLQPRRGGRMALRVVSGGVLIYNAHIESAKDDTFRHKQIDEIVIDQSMIGAVDQPVIVAGDFNTAKAAPESIIVQCLLGQGFADALGTIAAPRRTSVAHSDPLDWIFVRNVIADRGRVVDVRTRASDHFPLEATISVAAPYQLGGR